MWSLSICTIFNRSSSQKYWTRRIRQFQPKNWNTINQSQPTTTNNNRQQSTTIDNKQTNNFLVWIWIIESKSTNAFRVRKSSRDRTKVERYLGTVFNIVRLFNGLDGPKIERAEAQEQPPHQEWRRFVGSIRRRVQRHASDVRAEKAAALQTQTAPKQSFSRKNSLTSVDTSVGANERNVNLDKGVQKSESSSSSSKKVGGSGGGSDVVRLRPSISFTRIRSSHTKCKEVKQDDFLKATMRIFLVVSPPVGKIQVKCNKQTDRQQQSSIFNRELSRWHFARNASMRSPFPTFPLTVRFHYIRPFYCNIYTFFIN